MDFYRRVALVTDAIPAGRVATYGQIALLCGKPRCSRQVGQALSRGVSRQAYKVIGSSGKLSGAGAFLIPGLQAELLRCDGVDVSERETVDLARFGWRPEAADRAALGRAFQKEEI